MPPFGLTLVIVSALIHAGWNYLTKCSGNKLVFSWLFRWTGGIIYLPVVLWQLPSLNLPSITWLFVAATGLIDALYFWVLTAAYDNSDLSLAYPLSRGLGALLVLVFATLFLDERPSWLGLLGVLLIVAGVYILYLRSFRVSDALMPLRSLGTPGGGYAALTGVCVASYSLVDKVAVGYVPPSIYVYLMFTASAAFSTPLIGRRGWGRVRDEWHENWRNVTSVGVLCFSSYLLILWAMTMSPVSYIIALRNLSIVFGTLLGTRLLKEPYGRQRMAGSALVCLGAACIALA
ncbi:MAG: DMT family transporter [Chloroflexota bacterium]|nr:DMT family transporter [Chloroflexota bacterium]